MSQTTEYIQYLQQLLKYHKLAFKSQQQFEENNQKCKKIEIKVSPPLKTNIKQPLNTELIQRYSRQMLLKQFAYEGQVKIVNTKVAVVGAGGIGCPLALYLAAAGIGIIGLFDSDKVDITNLHRQIGHRTSTIGKQKTESLKSTLLAINPNINVKQHPFITANNVNILDQYDLVIDGSDNPTCRYIVNDYCMKRNRKLLSGACIGWQAQITCYGGDNLCYRCLWGNDQISLGGCSTLGVVGTLPGIVAMVLATEALKIILNGVSSLEGVLLTYNALKCEFKKIKLRKKQPNCIACGFDKLNISAYDYAKYMICSKNPIPEVSQISWKYYLQKMQNKKILDVRPRNQYNIIHLENTFNIPFENLCKLSKQQIVEQMKLDESEEVPVSCARGVMSRHGVKYLNSLGMKGVSIEGGILGYRLQFDDSIPEI